MIFTIAFANIGDEEEVYPTNKVIICILICLLSFFCQLKSKPFITLDLNNLNLLSNVIMILTLLFALFSAICENSQMKFIFLIALLCFNCYFLLIIVKSCLIVKLVIAKNSNILNHYEKYFGNNCIKIKITNF